MSFLSPWGLSLHSVPRTWKLTRVMLLADQIPRYQLLRASRCDISWFLVAICLGLALPGQGKADGLSPTERVGR